jgi:tetratricopeptide (TPR) repeat protein
MEGSDMSRVWMAWMGLILAGFLAVGGSSRAGPPVRSTPIFDAEIRYPDNGAGSGVIRLSIPMPYPRPVPAHDVALPVPMPPGSRVVGAEPIRDAVRLPLTVDAGVQLASASAVAALKRGISAFDRGVYREAVEAFSEAIVLDPLDADAVYDRATARLALGDGAGAIADLGRAIALEPGNPGRYVDAPRPGSTSTIRRRLWRTSRG